MSTHSRGLLAGLLNTDAFLSFQELPRGELTIRTEYPIELNTEAVYLVSPAGSIAIPARALAKLELMSAQHLPNL